MALVDVFWITAALVVLSAKHIPSTDGHQGEGRDKNVDEQNSVSARHSHRLKRNPQRVRYIRPKLSIDGVFTLVDMPYTTTPYNWGAGYWVVRQNPHADLDEWSKRKRRDSLDDPYNPVSAPGPTPDKQPHQFCTLPKDSGAACESIKRSTVVNQFFFNSREKRCETFKYHGCGGNGNRFSSLSACEKICAIAESPAGPA